MLGRERAQSEVLGTVLLLGLTVAVVGTTVALGGAARSRPVSTNDPHGEVVAGRAEQQR
ncbi:archaellin/type IV pilin N-terminal domain-containing protein [Halorubrum sp. BOL3-1]|uniref:archaellin/type IV pilin N-terminal domain-containing protein n=1 Tax=Halorubrum sp. BOL3-1 TaxID=2497325 RepID=UPI00140B6AC8|nr:archaellin/type IV pilin N-terminal domain-containing protein [Halorubrum sp. BOL3-1]